MVVARRSGFVLRSPFLLKIADAGRILVGLKQELLPRSGHSQAREINTRSRAFHLLALMSSSIFSLNNNNNDVFDLLDASLFIDKYDLFNDVIKVSHLFAHYCLPDSDKLICTVMGGQPLGHMLALVTCAKLKASL